MLRHLIAKEFRLLFSDLHGLALLFLMPAVFVLIMSFALDASFKGKSPTLVYHVIVQDHSSESESLLKALRETYGEPVQHRSEALAKNALERGELQALVIAESDYLDKVTEGELAVSLWVAPDLSEAQLLRLQGVLQRHFSIALLQMMSFEEDDSGLDLNDSLRTQVYQTGSEQRLRPSAVQQNVPAWLLFAMFFITVPLSNTLLEERAQGTLSRLRSMGVKKWQLLLGKIVPYFVINLLQAAVLLALGRYLMPVLGGEALTISGSIWALLLMIASASLAAISYAMLVAGLARTTEQATLVTGVCNLIMAALGGIMVPRFVMPPTMQQVSDLSPMSWGLQGFLDVILRSATVIDVLPEAGMLLAFGFVLGAIVLVLKDE